MDQPQQLLSYGSPRRILGISIRDVRICVMISTIGSLIWVGLVVLASVSFEPTGVLVACVYGSPFIIFSLGTCVLATFVITPVRRLITAVSLSLIVGGTVFLFDWPMKLAFLVHRDGLDRIAAAVAAGSPPVTPVRVGYLVVKKIETRRNAVCLWVDPIPTGPSGFVLCPPGGTPPCNIWSQTKLSGTWFYVEED